MTSELLDLAETIGDAFDDLFLDCVLTRTTTSGPAYDPTTTTASYTCKAIADNYGSYDRANDLVGATDMKVLILAGSMSVEPKSLDQIVITGISFSGQIVANGTAGKPAVQTDPAKSVWTCRCAT